MECRCHCSVGRTGREIDAACGRKRQIAVRRVHCGVSDTFRHLIDCGELNLSSRRVSHGGDGTLNYRVTVAL